MKLYEVVFILDPALSEEAVEAELKHVKGIVEREGGEVLEVQRWGKKRLAYEIRKKREGQYILIRFKSAPGFIPELERHFKLSEATLRHMVIKCGEPKKPSLLESQLSSLKSPAEVAAPVEEASYGQL